MWVQLRLSRARPVSSGRMGRQRLRGRNISDWIATAALTAGLWPGVMAEPRAFGAAPDVPGRAAAVRPPIVFTQLSLDAKTHGGGSLADTFLGAHLARLSPSGAVSDLTAGFHSAADPDVAWDGKKILFAAKKTTGDLWQI